MANQKVTDLTAITAITDDDLFMMVDAPGTTPASKKITWANVLATLGIVLPMTGTYTPTLFNTTNVAASTAAVCQWMRVGNMVTASGTVAIDPTAVGNTVLGFSLPVASNIGAAGDAGGTFVNAALAGNCGQITGDAANDRATFNGNLVDVANRIYAFIFMYRVI